MDFYVTRIIKNEDQSLDRETTDWLVHFASSRDGPVDAWFDFNTNNPAIAVQFRMGQLWSFTATD